MVKGIDHLLCLCPLRYRFRRSLSLLDFRTRWPSARAGGCWSVRVRRPTGLRTGRAIPGLRRDAALPVRQNTRQGREGGALPEPF